MLSLLYICIILSRNGHGRCNFYCIKVYYIDTIANKADMYLALWQEM